MPDRPRIAHVGIAVPDLDAALAFYRDVLGLTPHPPEQADGATIVSLPFGESEIELLAPLTADGPIARFLERNADGGIHHICYDVPDIIAARDTLIREGARVLGDGMPKIGAHGKPVLFLHPKDFSGALVEIEQA